MTVQFVVILFFARDFRSLQVAHPRLIWSVLAIQHLYECEVGVEYVRFSIVCPHDKDNFVTHEGLCRQDDPDGMRASEKELAMVNDIFVDWIVSPMWRVWSRSWLWFEHRIFFPFLKYLYLFLAILELCL